MERVCFDNLSKEKEKKGESNAVQGLERNELSLTDVNRLKHVYGTNNQSISVSAAEIGQTQKRLEILYPNCKVQWSFAERICLRNKAY